MKDILIELITNIQSTGGLIEFSDGLNAPAADPTWTDLGATVLKAHEELEKVGVVLSLDVQEVDYSSDDAEEYNSF